MDKINTITSIDSITLAKILASEKLTDQQKAQFIKNNSKQIKEIIKKEINKDEFKELMQNRQLIRFRPLKNSFTKQGDDIILAQSLNIDKKNIKKYINSIINNNFEIKNALDRENIEKTKTYVYRHGTRDQVIAYLAYELSNVKTTLQKLYKTLEYNSGGLADYFSRPIHRMSNITLGKLYNTIYKSLHACEQAGIITKKELNSTSQWALIRIYQIQNNSKLLKAYEIYKDLI